MLDSEQRTTEWHNWRKKGLGASESPAIMGVSPYMTAYQLWEIKTGQRENNASNFAIDRGNRLEPLARARYELISNVDMPAALVEHPEMPFMRASLDGYNPQLKRVLEIKVPNKEVFQLAKAGQVHEQYVYQLEHQLFVTGAEENHFFCVMVEGKGATERIVDDALVIYRSDMLKRTQLIQKCREFWECVQKGVPPGLSDKDTKYLDGKHYTDKFQKLKEAKLLMDKAKASYEAATQNFEDHKQECVALMDHSIVSCSGVKIQKVVRKGSVDYERVPTLNGVNLDEYRKPESVSYLVKLEREA